MIDARRKWWVLAAMGGVIGIVLLDETIVGVALPTIQSDLGISLLASHWVVNSYLLVFAGLVAAGGRLGDILGLRTLFTFGILLFGAASLACGFASSGTYLILARALQGIGAAIIFPASMAMVTIAFPEKERGVAIGIYGTIGTVFLALGPLVGGVLTDYVSWRWIFWINPPIILLIAALVLMTWIDPPRTDAKERFDFLGTLTLISGVGLTVFAIMQGPDWGWVDPFVIVSLIAGVGLFGLFVIVEINTNQPLIDVALFRNSSFAVCNFTVFMAQFTKIAVFIFGALYLQHALEMSSLQAGIALVAGAAPSIPTGFIAGKTADRFGSRKPALGGIFCIALSILWIGIAVHWESYLLLLPALLIWGAALPFLFVPPMRAIMNEVPIDKQGLAGGIVLCAQLLGGTIGMALCSTVFSTSQNYTGVFLMTAALTIFLFILAYLKIEPEEPEKMQT
ncbi:MFS transporter [Sneathiella marina]|uniref:MFS transporter n=1 Tax=Sneathiella marina TaxID=2950108 RepID=A0ABY4W3T2_9PROT|nr:MFS transporter [Sneathiella marina]USG61627.1 MFS transporter [Sneathiella marina]